MSLGNTSNESRSDDAGPGDQAPDYEARLSASPTDSITSVEDLSLQTQLPDPSASAAGTALSFSGSGGKSIDCNFGTDEPSVSSDSDATEESAPFGADIVTADRLQVEGWEMDAVRGNCTILSDAIGFEKSYNTPLCFNIIPIPEHCAPKLVKTGTQQGATLHLTTTFTRVLTKVLNPPLPRGNNDWNRLYYYCGVASVVTPDQVFSDAATRMAQDNGLSFETVAHDIGNVHNGLNYLIGATNFPTGRMLRIYSNENESPPRGSPNDPPVVLSLPVTAAFIYVCIGVGRSRLTSRNFQESHFNQVFYECGVASQSPVSLKDTPPCFQFIDESWLNAEERDG